MTETLIDTAHRAMEANPDDIQARMKYFERLADSELFLLLTKEAEGETLSPETFDISDGTFILAFDTEDRLSAFVGKAAPYAALSGRVIAGMLQGQGIGIALNPEVAPSSNIIDPQAVAWLAETVAVAPETTEARPESFLSPSVPEVLVAALAEKLATAAGLAHSAYLVGVAYDSGAKGHLLGVIDAVAGSEGAIAKAVNEALNFSGLEAAALDVTFLSAQDVSAAALAKVGLRFDIHQPETVEDYKPKAPGMDPDAPPILR